MNRDWNGPGHKNHDCICTNKYEVTFYSFQPSLHICKKNWPAKHWNQESPITSHKKTKGHHLWRNLTIVVSKLTKCAVYPVAGCSPLAYRHLCGDTIWCFLMRRFWVLLSVFHSHFLSPQEDPPNTPLFIRNSLHIVGPLCKRKSPWIIEAVSFCFSQSSVHSGKLISHAEALQKDLSKRALIVQNPLLGFVFFLTL